MKKLAFVFSAIAVAALTVARGRPTLPTEIRKQSSQ